MNRENNKKSVTTAAPEVNLADVLDKLLTNIVRPMIGPRCKTKDTHDFPDLEEYGRCLVCATYDAVDDARGLIMELLDGAYEQGYNARLTEETQKSDGCSCGFFPCRHHPLKPKKGKK